MKTTTAPRVGRGERAAERKVEMRADSNPRAELEVTELNEVERGVIRKLVLRPCGLESKLQRGRVRDRVRESGRFTAVEWESESEAVWVRSETALCLWPVEQPKWLRVASLPGAGIWSCIWVKEQEKRECEREKNECMCNMATTRTTTTEDATSTERTTKAALAALHCAFASEHRSWA